MTDRLADLVLGLQRLGENARLRGDDLRFSQEQETYDHIQWLDQLLGMVGKVHSALQDERRKFLPERDRVAQIKQDTPEKMPRAVVQGPRVSQG